MYFSDFCVEIFRFGVGCLDLDFWGFLAGILGTQRYQAFWDCWLIDVLGLAYFGLYLEYCCRILVW